MKNNSALKSSKIFFKHITHKNKNSVLKYITNPLVSKFLTWKTYVNKLEIDKYFNYAISCTNFPDEIFCIILNNEIIGTIHMISRGNKSTQIGFGLLPEFWNKGIGLRVLKKNIKFIKSSSWYGETKEIWAVIHKDNIYAKKLFLKFGFIFNKKNTKKNFDRYVLILE